VKIVSTMTGSVYRGRMEPVKRVEMLLEWYRDAAPLSMATAVAKVDLVDEEISSIRA